jgi:hypothetical protein
MSKFKGTKGNCVIDNSHLRPTIINIDIINSIVEENAYFSLYNSKDKETQIANAELITDAFETVYKCDLLPKELLSQRNELLDVLIEVVRISDRNHVAWNRAKETIKKVTE